MKAAVLFPGQGSQFVGMGKDLVDAYALARELFELADETLGFSLSRICFEGDAETLTATKNAQPAILIHSLVVLRILEKEGALEPAIAAGHSLGEYSALAAARVFSDMDALRVVRRRGELMYEAGVKQRGTMAAIIGLEQGDVELACKEASNGEIVVVANINSPGQIVISGHVSAVERAMKVCLAKGAKKAIALNVSGAFHSPLVASAQEELVSFIESIDMHDPSISVVTNVDAKVTRTKDDIINALSRQLTSPVRWQESMNTLLKQWSGPVLEIGPGKVLAGLLRRIDPSRSVRCIGSAPEIEEFMAARAL